MSNNNNLTMPNILVTGGTGYIGSHTVTALLEKGYNVTIIDNLINSNIKILFFIQDITKKKPIFYKIDLCDKNALEQVFKTQHFDAIIHFAALKSSPESIEKPNLYYYNNLTSLMNLVELSLKYKVKNFIFSSSCAVYGTPSYLPVDENHPFNEALSPYSRTKQFGEKILQDTVNHNFKVISLRYFNPVGAHPSAKLGDIPKSAANLMHFILEVALGKAPYLNIYGNDYDTPDGTPVRDYIYIMDVVDAHIIALERLLSNNNEKNYEYYNIGIGRGVSVLEMLHAFEKYTGIKIPYRFVDRRPGDIAYIYASTELIEKKLKWKAQYGLKEMILTSWNWAKKLNSIIYELENKN